MAIEKVSEANKYLIDLASTIGAICEIQGAHTTDLFDQTNEVYSTLIKGMLLLSKLVLYKQDNEIIQAQIRNIIKYATAYTLCSTIAHYPHNPERAKDEAKFKFLIKSLYENKIQKWFKNCSISQLSDEVPLEIETALSSIGLSFIDINRLSEAIDVLKAKGFDKEDIKEDMALFVSCIKIALKFQREFDCYSSITVTYVASLEYILDSYLDIVYKLLSYITKLFNDNLNSLIDDCDRERFLDTLNSLKVLLKKYMSSYDEPSLDENSISLLSQILERLTKAVTTHEETVDITNIQEITKLINEFLNKNTKQI